MKTNISLERQVSNLNVGELVELIRQTIREELEELLTVAPTDDLIAAAPPIRDIDTVIKRMEETGKYKHEFLTSLRKGMERSQSFQRSEAEPE